MDVSLMTVTIVHYALRFSLESASSKDLLANDAPEGTTSATNVDASGTSLTTCAITLTELTLQQFHIIWMFLYLWSSLRDEGPCQGP